MQEENQRCCYILTIITIVWRSSGALPPFRWAPVTWPAHRRKWGAEPAQRPDRQSSTCSVTAAAPLMTQARSRCPRTPSCPCMEPTACLNRLPQVSLSHQSRHLRIVHKESLWEEEKFHSKCNYLRRPPPSSSWHVHEPLSDAVSCPGRAWLSGLCRHGRCSAVYHRHGGHDGSGWGSHDGAQSRHDGWNDHA